MRELKFRIWDKQSNEFIYKHAAMTLTLDGKIFNYRRHELPEVVEIPEHFVIQQYTGIKDKNNKEIYDGDIINVARCHWGKIEKDGNCTSYSDVTEDGVEIGQVFWADCFSQWTVSFEHIRYDDNDGLQDGANHRYEVIGNIFENGDLINERD